MTTPNPPGSRELVYPKLSRWRRMQIPVIAAFVYMVVRLIGPTLRFEIVGVHNATQIRERGEPGIGAFWHRCIFQAVWFWRNRGIVVLNTVNFDGQWTRRVIERLGFGTAQGSSSRGAIEGLTAMAQRLEEGHHVALTIDGPRGPRYVAKPGAVILSPHWEAHLGIPRRDEMGAHLPEILGPFSSSLSLLSGRDRFCSAHSRARRRRRRCHQAKAG